MPGYQPPQQLVAFEKAIALQPNALFYIAAGREMHRSADYLAEAVRKRLPIPYPALQAIVDKSGVRADMDETAALKLLEPYKAEILKVVYDSLVEQSLKRGIRPVWIFVPQVRAGIWQEETPDDAENCPGCRLCDRQSRGRLQGPRHRDNSSRRMGRPPECDWAIA